MYTSLDSPEISVEINLVMYIENAVPSIKYSLKRIKSYAVLPNLYTEPMVMYVELESGMRSDYLEQLSGFRKRVYSS